MASDFAQIFASLENSILQRWDRNSEDHLATAATAVLSDHRAVLDIDPGACLEWATHESSRLPEQTWTFDFGQPAITIARNRDFRIDLLYWIENASATHDHVTCGAFSAIYGDRLHAEYDFVGRERIGPAVEVGELSRTRMEVMRQGDARPIRPDLIHDLFWLMKPSVTLVVRCEHHPGTVGRKPRSFCEPGIAFVPKEHQDSSLVSRRVEALELMRMADSTMYRRALGNALEGADASLAYYAFIAAAVGAPAILDDVLSGISAPSAILENLKDSRQSIVRRSHLAGLYTADKESRLLVGLLWAGADEAMVRETLETVFPNTDPRSVIDAGATSLEQIAPDVAPMARRLLSISEAR